MHTDTIYSGLYIAVLVVYATIASCATRVLALLQRGVIALNLL